MTYNQQFIGGIWRPGSTDKVLVDRNPFNDVTLAEFTMANAADVDEAYRCAKAAQAEWAQVNPYDKRAVFERAIAFLQSRRVDIIETIMSELGGTRLKANFEIDLAIDILKEAATLTLRMDGRILPSPIHGKENRVYRQPVGVIGVISPFNFPFFLGMKSVAPALATGNGVVLKPHENSPITGGVYIGQIFAKAGIPPGLLNIVVTDVAQVPEVAATFVEHAIPSLISFTGSAAVGARVAEAAGRNCKKVVLELGGNSAVIVLPDADLELAVDAAVFSRFVHQGQVCMAANRVLAHRDIYEEIVDRYVTKVKALRVGDPRDPETVIGPLINQRQADVLTALVEQGIADGARPALRGEVNGTLFHPVVLADVTPNMRVARTELFGPVACLMRYEDEDQAIAIANDSPFGLSGAIHTRNIDYGIELASRVDTGMIHINDATIHDEPIVSFGGIKWSGIGQLNGESSLREFTTEKWISIHRGRRTFPF